MPDVAFGGAVLVGRAESFCARPTRRMIRVIAVAPLASASAYMAWTKVIYGPVYFVVFPPNRQFCDGRQPGRSRRRTRLRREGLTQQADRSLNPDAPRGDQRVNGAADKDNEPNGQRHDHGLTRRPGPLSESAAMVRFGGRERTALCEGPRTVRKSVLVVAALTGSSPVVKTGGDAV